MWIIGISKLNRNIFCFTVYDQPTTKHWGNRTLCTRKCKWFYSMLRVNVLLFSDFNASGVPNSNGTPCFVISLTSTFFLSFLEWSKLRIITGDCRWFIWRGKFSYYDYGIIFIARLLLLLCPLFNQLMSILCTFFSVEWRRHSDLEPCGNRKWFDFVLAPWRKLSRSSGLNKSSLLVSLLWN